MLTGTIVAFAYVQMIEKNDKDKVALSLSGKFPFFS
jgi:hypothetical protein